MRTPLPLLLLCVAACGEGRVPPAGGRPAYEIVDVSDPDALADCYAPKTVLIPNDPDRFSQYAGQPTENCATECKSLMRCRSVCSDVCPPGDGEEGRAGACEPQLADSVRMLGYVVPKWPLKRCDEPPG